MTGSTKASRAAKLRDALKISEAQIIAIIMWPTV